MSVIIFWETYISLRHSVMINIGFLHFPLKINERLACDDRRGDLIILSLPPTPPPPTLPTLVLDGEGGGGWVAVKNQIIYIFLCHTLSDAPTILKLGKIILHYKIHQQDIIVICYFRLFRPKFMPKLKAKNLFPKLFTNLKIFEDGQLYLIVQTKKTIMNN